MKALFHINDGERWKLLLTNVVNLIEYGREYDVACQIEVVANGPAVHQLRSAGTLWADSIREVCGSVRFCACSNALRSLGIEEKELLPFVEVVPAGVAEIVLRQQEGFAYLKP